MTGPNVPVSSFDMLETQAAPEIRAEIPPKGRFARNTAYSSLAGLVTAVGGLICSIVVARLLGVSGAGVAVYALWIATVTAAVSDLGISACFTRFLPEMTSQGRAGLVPAVTYRLLRPALLAALLIPLVVLLGNLDGIFLGPARSSRTFDGPTLAMLLALCVTQTLANVFLSVQRGLQRFDRVARFVLVSMCVQIALVVAGGLWGGVFGILFGYFAGTLGTAVMVASLPRSRNALPPELAQRLRNYALFTWAANLTSLLVWSRIEIVFLKHSFGDEAVGLFSVGLTLSNLAVQGPLLLTGGILAFFSERTDAGSRASVEVALKLGTRLVALIILPLSLGLSAITQEIVPLMFGHGFDAAVPAAMILIAATGFGAVGTVASNLLYARERSDVIFYSNIAGGVLSIVCGLLIIPAFGLLGAALGRTLVQIAMLGLGFWFVMARLRFGLPLGDLARITVAALACAVCARLSLIALAGPIGLPVAILAGAVSYMIAIRLLRPLPADDIGRLSAACDGAPARLRPVIRAALRILMKP